MITYTFDDTSTYTDGILHLLREHNIQFTGNKERETYHIYILEDGHLLAAATVNYNWDWVSIGKLFYLDVIGLKHILHAIINRYKGKAVGIKFFTTDKNRLVDFISVGFEASGMYQEEATQITWYYANLYTFNIRVNVTYEIISSVDAVDVHDSTLNIHVENYNKKHNIKDKQFSFNIAAIDDQKCIGGVTCDVYDQTLYVSYLAVDKNYRKQGIGSKLMTRVEAEAKKRNLKMIDLGTSDFQAKGFYEKLGYNTVYTQKDQPRGYNTYTMIKKL